MPTSNRLVFLRSLTRNGIHSRTAVYGPVRTVVWQGSVGDHRPYADLTRHPVPHRVRMSPGLAATKPAPSEGFATRALSG